MKLTIIFYLAISKEGRLTTAAYMAEYNQDRFELEIEAKEIESPERTAKAKVFVSWKCVLEFFKFYVFINFHSYGSSILNN